MMKEPYRMWPTVYCKMMSWVFFFFLHDVSIVIVHPLHCLQFLDLRMEHLT